VKARDARHALEIFFEADEPVLATLLGPFAETPTSLELGAEPEPVFQGLEAAIDGLGGCAGHESALHDDGIRFALVGHALPPAKFLEHVVEAAGKFGSAFGKAHVAVLVIEEDDEPGGIQTVGGDGVRLDGATQQRVTGPEMDRVHRNDVIEPSSVKGHYREKGWEELVLP
jgi:hypothetical protein